MEGGVKVATIFLCIIAGLVCWGCTTLGASAVFLVNKLQGKTIAILLSLSAGVMISASFFSLLNPAVEMCEKQNLPAFLFVALGFFVGGSFIVFSSKILDRFFEYDKFAGHKGLKKSIMLASSITLHNIPEGMAVGVAFGALTAGTAQTSVMSAFMLAIGIGIQNIPEGASVSLPLRMQGVSKGKSFLTGMMSGVVEPIFAPIAFLVCSFVSSILPFLLSFGAGTMIAVATCELVPEAVHWSKHRAILFLTLGFVIMALLDLAFAQ